MGLPSAAPTHTQNPKNIYSNSHAFWFVPQLPISLEDTESVRGGLVSQDLWVLPHGPST